MKTLFAHAPNGNWASAHLDDHIKYYSWNWQQWSARLEGTTLIHAPGGDWSKAHTDSIINYISWDNENWTAKIDNALTFHHVKQNGSGEHDDVILNYFTWDKSRWTTRLILPATISKATCKNLTTETIWLKDGSSSITIPLEPTETFVGSFDGLCVPSERFVFKVVDGVSAIVKPGREVETTCDGLPAWAGQLVKGGRLKSEPDKEWTPLFERCKDSEK